MYAYETPGTRGPAVTFCVRSAAGAAAERCFPASPSPRSSQVDSPPPRSCSTTIVQSALLSARLVEPEPLASIASVSQHRDHRRAPFTYTRVPVLQGGARTASARRRRRCSEAPRGPALVGVHVHVVEHVAEPAEPAVAVPRIDDGIGCCERLTHFAHVLRLARLLRPRALAAL
jgi:hypothetical protein